jgi:hypothetical protein
VRALTVLLGPSDFYIEKEIDDIPDPVFRHYLPFQTAKPDRWDKECETHRNQWFLDVPPSGDHLLVCPYERPVSGILQGSTAPLFPLVWPLSILGYVLSDT